MIETTIPIRIESEPNMRGHWSARAKRMREHRASAWLALKLVAKWAPELLPCTVTLTRIAPRRLDQHDNLRGGFKGTVDGIADWLGIKDDDPRVSWDYAQERGRVREYAVRIRIEPDGR